MEGPCGKHLYRCGFPTQLSPAEKVVVNPLFRLSRDISGSCEADLYCCGNVLSEHYVYPRITNIRTVTLYSC